MLTKRDLLRSAALAGVAAAGAQSSQAWAQWSERPGFFKAKDIAEAGFIYGLPMVMAYGVMNEYAVDKSSGQYKAPFNTLFNEARVFTYEDTAVITPNSDTPYSFAWLDLRAEPLVFSVPAIDPKRYYSLQLNDLNTYNFGYVGTRATGSDAGSYMIVGPRWTGVTPAGIKKVFRSTTDFCLGLLRTQLFDPADIEAVKKIQAGYKAQPLSRFLHQPAPAPAPAPSFPKFEKDLVGTEFFEYLDFALQFAPALPEDRWIREQLARIGVGPGKSFDFRSLSLEDKAEILLGMKEGERKVSEAVATLGKDINGWRVGAPFGDAAFFHGDWLMRAAAAKAGIYGNDAVEAMYPLGKVDVDGKELDCSKSSYTLTFPAEQLPPVNAFWSVTMYDGKTQLLVKNPINRYLINSPMLPHMKCGSDGSLTIYVQNKSPGADKEANWLPAPDGPIYVVMRLYWPKTTPPSILPAGEGTWKPPGFKRAS
ncbi:DUF1254 domain-containing protein [Bradyrhizobium sp. Arg62]|uniref:DUF1254 domain-containing protein n=1 Tax=Bradyrhizobium brasilense TaxID=1419277 RepID=UPI001E447492|nr:DUF1254 domain-containing protein [Bradyrhizobium brasilense]MCC8944017.1 DUF1254 domain-containing protein [Bradyrhizobium brasilense]